MTPEEAVKKVVQDDIVHRTRVVSLASLRELFDACVATAKAEGKRDETRRCAARVREQCDLPRSYTATIASLGDELANDLLITGGLEANT